MTIARVLTVVLTVSAAACGGGEPPPSDPEIVWAAAEPWVHADGVLLNDDWAFSHAASVSLPDELLERVSDAASRIEGGLRMLAVTQRSCIDSAHSIPYLAAVADAVPGLTMRAVGPRMGGALMEAHPTPDGRAATPTVLLLDDRGEVRGCWIERPAPLQYWYVENPEDLGRLDRFGAKTDWYEADRGVHVVSEMARILEAVADGEILCGLPMEAVTALPEPGVVVHRLPDAAPDSASTPGS